MRKIINSNIFKVAIICLILACLIIVPNIIVGKGVFTLTADYNIQQIPFNIAINNSLRNGSYLWCWFNDLGSNFIATFSFYNLFSPFNIIAYIFPASWFKYLIGPIFILKYVVAGITSYLFLQRYVKNKKYAILGAILYSFSGFQLTNTLFYHFHDVVALFPLLLYTLDNYWYDNKKYSFMFCVALLALTNWFFFIGQVIFLTIYFIINIIFKKYEWNLKKFLHLALESVLGVGMSAFVLLPTALFTIGNPRVNSSWSLKDMILYRDKRIYMEIMRALIFPNQILGSGDFITDLSWTSCELYLPIMGFVFTFSYVYKNRKNIFSIILFILFIMMCFPILNSSYFLFTKSYYARWFYIFILISSVLSIKAIDDDVSLKPGIIVSIIIFIIISLFMFAYYYFKSQNLIFNMNNLIIYIILFIVSIIVCLIYNSQKYKSKNLFLYILVGLFVVVWGNYTIYRYKGESLNVDTTYINYLNLYNNVEFDKDYRTNTYDLNYNIGYLNNNMNIKSWNSNINKENFTFYNSLDYNRDVATVIDVTNIDFNSFLSVKYVYSSIYSDLTKYGYELYKKKDDYNIFINKNVKKFGIVLNDYDDNENFKILYTEDKYSVITKKIILNKDQIEKYSNLIKNNGKIISNEYEFVENGFIADVNVKGDTFILYTFPCDEGWTIKVNGEIIDYENIDDGLIGFKINDGNNRIEFSYFPKGLKIGLIVSIISFILGILLFIVSRRKK